MQVKRKVSKMANKMKTLGTKEQQLKRVGDALQELSASVTESDKGFVMFSLNISIDTVRRYLKGEVSNLDNGVRMVEIFRQRIKERQAA